ncbi:hypothetical protein [Blastopirellula marina]|uniref:Uncharacterized protein n=1 Tax=Blastopirellula marina TaxID=124 RepID=A0A2S8GRV5_9BACT|nr:hypothetical protein [Blastopirellula marina]PQO46754.1 hypothetical protein C5Y93_07945 [Blastopirellula marina]
METAFYGPTIMPLLMVSGGIAWNAACVFCAANMSGERNSMSSKAIWLRTAGWIGYAAAMAGGAFLFVMTTL